MPGAPSFFQMREILKRESLQALLSDEGLVEGIKSTHGLLDVVDRTLPDLPGVEREWLGQIPKHLREAVRAVIASVALDDVSRARDRDPRRYAHAAWPTQAPGELRPSPSSG